MGLWSMHQGTWFLWGYNYPQLLAIWGLSCPKQLPGGHGVLCYHRNNGEKTELGEDGSFCCPFWLFDLGEVPTRVSQCKHVCNLPAQHPVPLSFDNLMLVFFPYSQPIWFEETGCPICSYDGHVTQPWPIRTLHLSSLGVWLRSNQKQKYSIPWCHRNNRCLWVTDWTCFYPDTLLCSCQ